MEEQDNKKIDEAHLPGGLYRVGDRVVDAEGRDLGDEAVAKADQIDADVKAKAEKDNEEAKRLSALQASGGLGQALETLLSRAAAGAPVTGPASRKAVTKPAANSQVEKDDNAPEPSTPGPPGKGPNQVAERAEAPGTPTKVSLDG